MARHPDVGDQAPDFDLDGTAGRFRLSEHRGERVLLLFYPGDNTPVCTRQFCSYRDNPEDMSSLPATVVGISAQGIESHREFTTKHGLTVPLLADEDGAVAQTYSMRSRLTGTRRGVVIVDEGGIVRHRHDHALGLDFLDAGELREALHRLDRPSGVDPPAATAA